MSGYRLMLSAGLFLLLVTGTASAQDERTVGLVMGAPLQVGLLWQATDRVAVRPGLSTSRSSSDFGISAAATGYRSESTSTRLSAGATLLIYLTGPADLRTYVAPRYGFSRSTIASRSSLSLLLPPGLPPELLPRELTDNETRNTQVTHEGGILFGVQQAIGSRFHVFGEVGVTFATSSSPSGLAGVESSGTAVGTTGGVGVAWMF